MGSTWRTRVPIVGYCFFGVITTFVNKHVLSNLHFTYPTVFQSWQTGSSALALLSMSTLGFTDLNIVSVNRSVLRSWLPASVLFSATIYSGSVALSRLPVPVFCAIHYISTILQTLVESIVLRQDLPIKVQLSLIMTALAVVMVAATDTKFDQIGYKWMLIHCTFSALYILYANSRKKNSFSALDQMFCNAVTSVIILMTISVATGKVFKYHHRCYKHRTFQKAKCELFTLIEFPYLYSSDFHLWCLGSGVSGALLSIYHGFLLGTQSSNYMEKLKSLNKVAVSFLSLWIFDASLNLNMALSISVALCSGVLHSFSDNPWKESGKWGQVPIQDT
ncbi:UDP-N-acetylglucosamine transporter TMEM241 homolog isoform X1 [Montipora capricornis]|uniref:UDP-N-acetylglucosamine transporter TMEM241 homolog isoform X1 n=1 Tax=Montipora capricornis TaxID=246305 RepID=UPI0035F10F97